MARQYISKITKHGNVCITLRHVLATIIGKAASILCECVLPYLSSMQWASAMLSTVVCTALQYFSPLSHKRHDFLKKLLNTKCVLISSTTFVRSISHSKNPARYDQKCLVGLLFLSDFNETWIFWTMFRKILKLHENPSSEPNCSMRADRWSMVTANVVIVDIFLCSRSYVDSQCD
jgi:hypothetical protein